MVLNYTGTKTSQKEKRTNLTTLLSFDAVVEKVVVELTNLGTNAKPLFNPGRAFVFIQSCRYLQSYDSFTSGQCGEKSIYKWNLTLSS